MVSWLIRSREATTDISQARRAWKFRPWTRSSRRDDGSPRASSISIAALYSFCAFLRQASCRYSFHDFDLVCRQAVRLVNERVNLVIQRIAFVFVKVLVLVTLRLPAALPANTERLRRNQWVWSVWRQRFFSSCE